jgi:thiol:disulfide interchange protein
MKFLATLLATSLPLLAQGTLNWEHDLAAAQKRALKEGKPLFVDIWAEWCPPCQHLKNNVFPSPDAQKALARYVPVSLMTETKGRQPNPANMKIAAQFRVEAYPTLLILDGHGKESKRQVGAFRNGAELAAWLAKK